MNNPLDDLDDDVAGDDKSVPATPVAPSPRVSGDNMVTLKERALQGLPAEWRERAISDAGECGVRHDNDVGWLLIGSTVQTLFCAFAAGDAAAAVQAGVAAIPDQIFQGAVRAGNEVKGALAAEIRGQGVEVGQALRLTITDAANKGAVALKTAAADLDIKLGKIPADVQKSLDAYKERGVADFAKAAAVAGKAAATSSMAAQLSRSAMTMVMVFLFACMVGAGGLWGYLLLTHRVMPAGVIAVSDPLRGTGTLVSIPNGGTPVKNCSGGLCVYYKTKVPDMP